MLATYTLRTRIRKASTSPSSFAPRPPTAVRRAHPPSTASSTCAAAATDTRIATGTGSANDAATSAATTATSAARASVTRSAWSGARRRNGTRHAPADARSPAHASPHAPAGGAWGRFRSDERIPRSPATSSTWPVSAARKAGLDGLRLAPVPARIGRPYALGGHMSHDAAFLDPSPRRRGAPMLSAWRGDEAGRARSLRRAPSTERAWRPIRRASSSNRRASCARARSCAGRPGRGRTGGVGARPVLRNRRAGSARHPRAGLLLPRRGLQLECDRAWRERAPETSRAAFEVSRVPPVPPGAFDVVMVLETMLAFPDKRPLLRGDIRGPPAGRALRLHPRGGTASDRG